MAVSSTSSPLGSNSNDTSPLPTQVKASLRGGSHSVIRLCIRSSWGKPAGRRVDAHHLEEIAADETAPVAFGAVLDRDVEGLIVLRDHVQQYPPEWAAGVSGVSVEQIRRIGRELGQHAMIGSTTVVDGVTVPYRPVAYGLHGTAVKFHSALQTNRAILQAFMILGALEAAGGPHLWNKKVADPTGAHARWVEAAAKETPDRLDLGGTKWFPLGSSGYHMIPVVVPEPGRYQLPYRPEEMVVLVHFVNPVIT